MDEISEKKQANKKSLKKIGKYKESKQTSIKKTSISINSYFKICYYSYIIAWKYDMKIEYRNMIM